MGGEGFFGDGLLNSILGIGDRLTIASEWLLATGRNKKGGLAGFVPALGSGDPEIARQLYSGEFTLAGQTVRCRPDRVFATPAPSKAWLDELHSFTWLVHLTCARQALHRVFARGMLQAWWQRRRSTSVHAHSRRLISFSQHAGFLLEAAPAEFEQVFLGQLQREFHRLQRLRSRDQGTCLEQAIALLTASLVFRGLENSIASSLARVGTLVDRMVLPDGGFAGRSPAALLQFLLDVVPLREALTARRLAMPRELNAAIERAMVMLRLLTHGDQGLAVFQGVGDIAARPIETLFARDAVSGRPLSHASHSGYARLNHGASVVVVDCGEPSLCDSRLAFEFSSGADRVVVSCGYPAATTEDWRIAAACAAAHSTLDIEGDGSVVPLGVPGRGRNRPVGSVACEVTSSPLGSQFRGISSGYAVACGIHHRRELFLTADGTGLRGEDSFAKAGDLGTPWSLGRFCLRFHLHPSVRWENPVGKGEVDLVLPSGEIWHFEARGGQVSVEESIWLATGGKPRKSSQICIRGLIGRPEQVHWTLRRRVTS